MRNFAAGLVASRSVAHVTFEAANLGGRGALAIAGALRENYTVEELHLGENGLANPPQSTPFGHH